MIIPELASPLVALNWNAKSMISWHQASRFRGT